MHSKPISIDELKAKTHQFFQLHWCQANNKLVDPPPDWDGLWHFQGTIHKDKPGIPNQEKPGCYALLEEGDNVAKIGVGASQAPGDYQHAGLGKRLHKYWRVDKNHSDLPTEKRKYKPSDGYEWLKGIMTIGFDKDYGYLARALEAFLIAELEPSKNRNLKKSTER